MRTKPDGTEALPGVDVHGWTLHLRQQAAARGEDVVFTPEDIEAMHRQALYADEHFTLDELRQMYPSKVG